MASTRFLNSMGTPLKDGLAFVDSYLKTEGIRDKICLVASGKSFTGFDLVRNFALGADVVNSARGMMLALGCIQALQCHSNKCPVGIATNNPRYMRGLVVENKVARVANYHQETLKAAKDLLGAMGKTNPNEVLRSDIVRRSGSLGTETFEEVYSS